MLIVNRIKITKKEKKLTIQLISKFHSKIKQTINKKEIPKWVQENNFQYKFHQFV